MLLKRGFKPWPILLGVGLLLAFGREAHAMKEVFVRSKPHVIVGTIGGQETPIWIHAQALLFSDGAAHGILQLRLPGGAAFMYRATAGWTDGTVLYLMLVRVGQDGQPSGEMDLATVRPSSTAEDCLIYDFVGPNVHLEAPGSITLIQRARAR